ncbi:MAG: leucine-rich repeat domain-containing protein [Candidatus Hodarchaeota archaeon]
MLNKSCVIFIIISIFFFLRANSAFGIIPQEERDALIALYISTDGDNWDRKDNWLGPPGTEDTWYGITVTNDYVTSVFLKSNNLIGSIPPEFGNLTSLQELQLDFNQLTGSVPPELGNLLNLQYLDLHSNQLTGIPSELGNLINLQYLDLSSNLLTGSIPSELGNLLNLQHLNLNYNQLTGSIPPELGNLINLQYLDLSYNQLTGSIPPEVGNLTSLQELLLHFNQLTGSIPPEVGNLANLQYLYLSNNQLTGNIQPTLENLGSLQDLELSNNQLTGSIPPELANMTNLQYLYLRSNQLTGNIPSELGFKTSLRDLYLSDNQLTGSIPPTLGLLIYLERLSLAENQLTESIPPELGNLLNLQHLNLNYNQLTGSIPLELGDLSNLQDLELSDNQLTGNIPPALGNLTNLQDLGLSDNQLTGNIPTALSNLTGLQTLSLGGNQLTDSIPAEIGNLTNLRHLGLWGNKLSGIIPSEIVNLTSLFDNGSDFRWNALYTDDDSIRDFLNLKQYGGNWENTQTVAPTDLSATPLSGESIKVSWSPIQYTSNEGGYRIFKNIASGGPWTEAGMTESKSAFEFDITGLNLGTSYYFVIQTQTDPHSNNRNTILSEYSEEVSATTLQYYVLIITSRPGGTTNPAPGTYAYDPAAGVSVKAIPDSGYKFSGWSGDASGTTNPITITMDSDKSITANFNRISTGDGEKGKKGGCFIATAAYNSPFHPHLDTLQEFRDKYLTPNKLGRKFVNLYYRYSPSWANFIAKHKILKLTIRISLLPLVVFSYSMIHFGPIITAIMIGFVFMLLILLTSFHRRKLKRIS